MDQPQRAYFARNVLLHSGLENPKSEHLELEACQPSGFGYITRWAGARVIVSWQIANFHIGILFTSTEHSPIIPVQVFIFGALVAQLPIIYQLVNQEILVIPIVADLGTQEHTVLIGFSLTDKEIRWETKIEGF